MTFGELVSEAWEKTHWPVLDIAELARRNWPTLDSFTPTQANLLIHLIHKKEKPVEHL